MTKFMHWLGFHTKDCEIPSFYISGASCCSYTNKPMTGIIHKLHKGLTKKKETGNDSGS